MNTVTYDVDYLCESKYCLEELLLKNQKAHTAFIGRVGWEADVKLYLLTYNSVVKASDPFSVWSGATCPIYVKRFVDIDITIKDEQC
jgi:hypothetical protein